MVAVGGASCSCISGALGGEFENVDGFASGRNAEKGRCRVESHAVDVCWHRASSELIQLLCRR